MGITESEIKPPACRAASAQERKTLEFRAEQTIILDISLWFPWDIFFNATSFLPPGEWRRVRVQRLIMTVIKLQWFSRISISNDKHPPLNTYDQEKKSLQSNAQIYLYLRTMVTYSIFIQSLRVNEKTYKSENCRRLGDRSSFHLVTSVEHQITSAINIYTMKFALFCVAVICGVVATQAQTVYHCKSSSRSSGLWLVEQIIGIGDIPSVSPLIWTSSLY